MVDISSQNNKINVTVSSSGNTANTNVTPDYAQYYSEKSREWATSNKIVDNTDYSSKYYANESKKQADVSTAKATEVVESGNTAVSNIEMARDNAITNVNTAGATQVALATEQATIATNKASEVVASGNEALSNIDTAKNNAIKSITNQETKSKNVLIDEGATQVGLIQDEGATQIANVQSTGFYMRDDKLYFINSQGEETEFKSGGSGLELCDIGMALYVDETKGLRRYLNGQIVDINTNTQAFLDRLLEIKSTNPDYFTTEDNWQAEALLNIDGCVYKFVLNYADDGETVVSVRLPKYPDYVIQTTLKQTKLKLRYFIQIATGSETENNIINEIELNNPYSLFDSKYSDHELNNLSWLKSEGQWNAKTVYTDAYDKLLKVQNGTETVEGLSVKLSTETYTDYDFVLNTTDETFRLPLKTKLASGKAVVGNGQTSDNDLYLYFYVGETVQNANLINAGRIEEKLADKVDYANTQWATNACMPDYSAGVSITLTTTGIVYTPITTGYIALYRHGQDGQYKIEIFKGTNTNGVPIQFFAPASQFNTGYSYSYIPVIAGEDYFINTNSITVCSAKFYPCKGAN